MKKQIITLLAASCLLSGSMQAQQVSTFTPEQQANIEAIKQEYISNGMSEDKAEDRAKDIVYRQGTNLQLRSVARSGVKPIGSIWIDRDTSSITGAYHPIYHNYTAEQLIKKVLLNNPAAESAVSNVTFNGTWSPTQRSLAYFEYEGNDFEISKGLVLATCDVLSEAEGPNAIAGGALNGGSYSMAGDPDLTPLISPYAANTGSDLEFDFVPYANKATFDFIFASEEYPQYSNSVKNDVFGFFVSEVDDLGNIVPGTTHNIAFFPDGTTTVTINNSNWGNISSSLNDLAHLPNGTTLADNINPQWHKPVYQNSPLMEYGGRTIKLQAIADNLTAGKKYHLALKIANTDDPLWGSAVFLANLDLGTPDVGVDAPYYGTTWSAAYDAYGLHNLYSNCVQTMTLKFKADTMDRKISLGYIGVASKKTLVGADGNPLPDSLDLAAGDSIITLPFKTLEVPLEDNGQTGAIVACVVGGGCDTMMANKTTKTPYTFYSGITTNIKYVPKTIVYAGSLKLNLSGGSNYVFRSIDSGLHWEFARDTITGEEIPFTNAQISNFEGDDKTIWLREPNACTDRIYYHWTTDTLGADPDPLPSRPIEISQMNGATLNVPNGIHYVVSGSDFSFTITPTGENAGKRPVVTTGRTTPPDNIGVVVKDNGDGTFTVTIREVKSPIELGISFTSNPDANMDVDGTNIYSSHGTIYITAATAGTANIYQMSGSLYKTVTFAAGETSSVSAPAGVYVVTLSNGKSYKIAVQ